MRRSIQPGSYRKPCQSSDEYSIVLNFYFMNTTETAYQESHRAQDLELQALTEEIIDTSERQYKQAANDSLSRIAARVDKSNNYQSPSGAK